jgi:predicted MFS family arabinose efflux permease
VLAQRAGRLLVWLLLGVDFLDELGSGVPFLGAPGIQSEFGVTYGMAAGWPQTALLLLSVLLEPPLLLLADRYPRKRFIVGGLVLLGLLTLAAAFAPTYWTLLAIFLLWGPTAGLVAPVSQATLMDAHPDRREQMMARWTLFGGAGDLATPLTFALLAPLGLGWRAAFAATAVAMALYAVALATQRFPAAHEHVAERSGERSLRSALANRKLLLWCTACSLTCLLDELVLSFGALHLRDHHAAGEIARSIVLGTFVAGGIVGLVVADRLLVRFEPLRFLLVTSAVGAALVPLWVLAPSAAGVAGVLFVLGGLSATYYPIVKAQAYRALPGRSGAVNAVDALFTPVAVLAPLGLGVVADASGLVPAILLLGLEPVGILAIALWALRRGR